MAFRTDHLEELNVGRVEFSHPGAEPVYVAGTLEKPGWRMPKSEEVRAMGFDVSFSVRADCEAHDRFRVMADQLEQKSLDLRKLANRIRAQEPLTLQKYQEIIAEDSPVEE